MNGNFRAWPYELNRMDSDNLPNRKFNPISPKLFSESQLLKEKEKWTRFVEKYPTLISHIDELEKKLLDWSFCKRTWALSEIQDIRKEYRKIVKQIICRNINMLEHWYQEHLIEDLLPVSKTGLKNLFNTKQWKKVSNNRKMGSIEWDSNAYEIYIGSTSIVEDDLIRPYLYYPKMDNIYNVLGYKMIRFGFYNKKGSLLKQIKGNSYIERDWDWVENNFTLKSFGYASYDSLLLQLMSWIESLSLPDHIEIELITSFKNSLKKFSDKI